MNKRAGVWLLAAACAAGEGYAKDRSEKAPPPLEDYIQQARGRQRPEGQGSPGSLWSPNSPLGNLGQDLRGARIDDMVTILVMERATAISRGATSSSRSSKANAGVRALGVVPAPHTPLPNLAGMSSETALDGSGQTSRETALTATLTARVAEVLPNGLLIVEGYKKTVVNSEQQTVLVRGVVRPVDLGPGNTVLSDRVGQMEIFVDGKGVVGDAIRRPNVLYRILLGLLPF